VATPSLSGRWTLNPELTDDARQRLREGMEKGRGPGMGGGLPGGFGGGGGPGMGGGPAGRGGGPPGGMPGAGSEESREAMRSVMEPAEELTIAGDAAEIAIDEKYGRLRRLHPDGKKYKAENGTAELKCSWRDRKLLVETKRVHGPSTVETWERVPDGTRLIVIVRLDGGLGPKLELKRVYDLAPRAGS
jgi:hypothetical protein